MTWDDGSFETRFGGIVRLYGRAGAERLARARVAVVGVGGVGSWTVEALARSGVGSLTLIDLDEVCTSNVNRQLHALDDTVGQSKVAVMAARVRGINPRCEVAAEARFFTESTAAALLSAGFDCVVDAIDQVANKCLLIAACRGRGIPVVVSGGAGGRRDPTALRVADLARTSHDPLLAEVRSRLRRDHGFSRDGGEFGVPCVFTQEPPVYPAPDGSVCGVPPASAGAGESLRMNCNSGFGSAAFVTGAFGLAAAAVAVRCLTKDFR
jgi:tRNA A37 threonylcarbamoyladenosine dehydratase